MSRSLARRPPWVAVPALIGLLWSPAVGTAAGAEQAPLAAAGSATDAWKVDVPRSLAEAPRCGVLALRRLSRAPGIDGDLADWPADVPVVALPETCGTVLIEKWRGKDDLSATLRAAYDARALYLAIQVRDDQHHAPAGEPMWQNDSIQFAIDPGHERTEGDYGPRDSEYSFALASDGKPVVDCWRPAEALGDRSREMQLAVRRGAAETLYEAAIPWGAIGVRFREGGFLFGFSLLVNDNDGSGRRGYLELTPGIGKTKDPSQYLTAVAGVPGDLAAAASPGIVALGRPMAHTAVYLPRAPLPEGTRLSLTLGPGGAARSVALPAGAEGAVCIRARVPVAELAPGAAAVRAIIGPAGGAVLAQAESTVEVRDPVGAVRARVDALRPKLAAAIELAQQAEARKIATDYERLDLAVAEKFLDFALDDTAHDRGPRAEHVVDVVGTLIDGATSRLRDVLAGRTRPLPVPRFVTGPVSIRDGVFWGDTVVPSTGKRERRPVFFTGYGHFGRVVDDLPKFPSLGANIIQIECGPWNTQPKEGVITDEGARNFLGRALSLGEEHGVMVCWLVSPHYFPEWALKKWPDLRRGGGGFLGFTVDAPQARSILKTHLETVLGAIKTSPALHSVCLSNEPTYTRWAEDPFRLPLWHAYLKRIHGTIEQLNAIAGTQYASFDDVPLLKTDGLPQEGEMTPLRYDLARFNLEQFAEFHRFLADTVRRVRPGTWTHAKVMPVFTSRQNLAWGCDPEAMALLGDLNGNDCWMLYRGPGDQYAAEWMTQNLYYDLQSSMRPVPVFNTENHLIRDREQRLIPPEHTDCVIWQGAIHGQGATTTWVWERTYDKAHDFEGSVLHRPENVVAHGRAGLDLMRLAPEVARLQKAPAPVAILNSVTSRLWSYRPYEATARAYEALNFSGVRVAFVSERQACLGELRRYRAVVLPAVRHVPQDVYQALRAYARGGGKVWVIGPEALGRDEYSRPRQVDLPAASLRTWPEEATAQQLRAGFLDAFGSIGVRRRMALQDEQGAEPWGVEYRAVPDGRGSLVSLVNLWGLPKRVTLQVNGRPAREATDLRAGKQLDLAAPIELRPLQATLLRVR